jgi:prenyltransferase beta subunit
MGRRLSHVKVDFRPRKPPAAKAYFGFGRLWRMGPVADRAPVQRAALRAAIARGAAFLLAQRAHAAPWKDFHGVQGGSDEWASAYVAAALARNRGSACMRAARATWTWLAGLRTNSGWGFSPPYPADADSTLWALRLAAMLGEMRAPCARAALSFMQRHRKRDGGVATFVPETLGASGSARGAAAVAGWCGAHAEVTAAAGALPGFGKSSAAWLLRAQRRDGRWQAYWYDEDAFATALAAEHVASRGGPAARRALARAARWAASRVARDGSVSSRGVDGGSAFAAACCLRILLAVRDPEEAHRAMTGRLVAWLVAAQRAEGGWPGSVPLRVPLPGDLRPAGFGARMGFSRDERGFFTTATVLDALGRVAPSATPEREARVPRRNGVAASASRRGMPAAALPRRSGSRSRRR